jgi:hypothetical protein
MHPDLEKRVARLLRELPGEPGQPYGFDEFERRARLRAARPRAAAAALAIVAVLAVAAAVVLRFGAATPAPHGETAQRETAAAAPRASATDGTAVPAASGACAELMEQWLARLPREPAVVRVGTRAAVLGLEDRIAQVDDLLSVARAEQAQPARLAALQQERTRLVGTLLEVRYAETLADASR